jgi:hypothetical protein
MTALLSALCRWLRDRLRTASDTDGTGDTGDDDTADDPDTAAREAPPTGDGADETAGDGTFWSVVPDWMYGHGQADGGTMMRDEQEAAIREVQAKADEIERQAGADVADKSQKPDGSTHPDDR